MTSERMVEILTAIGSVHEPEEKQNLVKIAVDVKVKNEFSMNVSDVSISSMRLTERRSELASVKIYVKCNTACSGKMTEESRAA